MKPLPYAPAPLAVLGVLLLSLALAWLAERPRPVARVEPLGAVPLAADAPLALPDPWASRVAAWASPRR